uniref:ARAD1C33528p n=1 Tax=Blastobotrys adeninivorans TaxID=409370 RepID=A0A060T847_BLAAD
MVKKVAVKSKKQEAPMSADFEQLPDEEEFKGFGSTDEEKEDNFDSTDDEEYQSTDDEEEQVDAEPVNEKQIKSKTSQAKKANKEKPGVVYVGRIPHGFYEDQMRAYFSQFGTITKLRLSRNKKTGRPKHYAFIEFESEEVAQIVAESMDNYLLFGHILKVKVIPPEKVHEDLFVGANRTFRPMPWTRLARQRNDRPKDSEKWNKLQQKHEDSIKAKNERLAKLGINYSFDPSAPAKSAKNAKVTKSKPKTKKKATK